MKPLCVFSINCPSDNFFSACFIHVDSNRQMICYVLDGGSSNTDILLRLIKQCSLIGYQNNIYDDIILNYISYQKDINTKEIFALSELLLELKEKGQQPWRHEDVSFYTNRDVDSIDLSYVISIEIEQYPFKEVNKAILDTLIEFQVDRSEKILKGLNDFKKAQHYGFRKNYKKRDDLFLNYINDKIGLTNNWDEKI